VTRAAAPRPDEEEEAVAAWLAAHPDFLARRPELYRALTPPRRVHGETLADHMAAMLAAERARLAGMQAAIAEGRAGAGFQGRVGLAVLALLGARDVADCVQESWPALLGLESVALLAEPGGRARGLRAMPAGMLARLLGKGRAATVRPVVTEATLLHREAAALVLRDALVRVPLGCGTPCLLALGAREASALPLRHAGPGLAFLGRAVAAALAR
jgi:uncharacterized protein YigA (DUF484 family)